MSLDIFNRNIDDAVAYAGRVSAPELPATFTDTFDEAWNHGRLVEQSISGENRRLRALSDYLDEVKAKTGEHIEVQNQFGEAGTLAEVNGRVRAMKTRNPSLDLTELTSEDVQRRADEIGTRAVADNRAMDRRERTWGGTAGAMLGTTAAAFTDPVNLLAFPLAAPESLGILGTALAWGAIGAGSQGVIEALNSTNRERVEPGYTESGGPVMNILETGAFGSALGGGIKGLSTLWAKQRGGSWPRTVRDAGNVIDSEAQIADSNPFAGTPPEGVPPIDPIAAEATHRTALSKAVDDVANGRPVDVEAAVPPEMAERLAAHQEPREALGDATKHGDLEQDDWAKATQKTSDYWESRLEEMSASERAAAGATDDVAAAEMAKLRDSVLKGDADVADTVSRELDRLLIDRPDLEMPTGAIVDEGGAVAPAMTRVKDVVADADARLAAAKEIEACAGPLQTAARVA